MGFSGRGAQLSTLIRSALPTLLGRTDTNPLDGMACQSGTNYRDEGHVCLIPVSAPEQVQSEMPIWTFFSEVPAARGPSSDDSAETEQSDWLKERSNPS